MFKGRMPDISPAVAMAVITWLVSQFAAYGWVDDETKTLALSGASTLFALGVKAWDAYVRGNRAKKAAAEAMAAAGHPVA